MLVSVFHVSVAVTSCVIGTLCELMCQNDVLFVFVNKINCFSKARSLFFKFRKSCFLMEEKRGKMWSKMR